MGEATEVKKPAPAKPAGAPKPAAKAAGKPAAKKTEQLDTIWSRRDFFSYAGWAAFAAMLGLNSLYFARLLFPRVLFEPSPKFKAGRPEDYTIGEVSTKWIKDQRVWVIREDEGLYAILARCTHLGCTPLWLRSESKYKCPCHGSGFTMQGINFEGPAPRPLERLKVEIAPDGQIMVDKSKVYLFEKGEWEKPGALIRV